MKSITAFVVLASMLFTPAAFAACPNITGPYCLFLGCWYEYEQSPTCAGTTGNVSNSTMWCYNTPAKSFGTGSSSATYTFTIGASDPVASRYEVDLRYVEWSDPNASIYNTLSATVSVTHNGSTTSQTFYSINGTVTKSCALSNSATFYATAGDTVSVTINTTIYNSNVTAQVGAPLIFAHT
jgi:opacity protein-like surface antigen